MKPLTSSIPVQRIVLYVMVLSLLPILLSYLYVDGLLASAHENQIVLSSIGDKIATRVLQQQDNRRIKERYKHTDPLFLHKKIESLPLMEAEIARLKEHLSKSYLPEDISLERRLQNLLHTDNRCTFLETSLEEGLGYKQTLESMNKPVEMDNEDIEKVLTLLESDQKNAKEKPHLIIAEAQFDRRKNAIGDSWNVLLKVLRREYTP